MYIRAGVHAMEFLAYDETGRTSHRALRLDAVVQKTGLSKSYTYKLIKCGEFPPPKKIRDRVSVWDEREIDAWLEKKFSDSAYEDCEE
jgi:prophage regulatory protein